MTLSPSRYLRSYPNTYRQWVLRLLRDGVPVERVARIVGMRRKTVEGMRT